MLCKRPRNFDVGLIWVSRASADSQHCRLVSRSELAIQMIQAAAKDPNISLHFGASPLRIDLAKQTVVVTSFSRLRDESGAVLQYYSRPQRTAAHAHVATASAGSHVDGAHAAVHTIRQAHGQDQHEHAASEPAHTGMVSSGVSHACNDVDMAEAFGRGCPDATQPHEDEGLFDAANAGEIAHSVAWPYDLLLTADGAHSKVCGLGLSRQSFFTFASDGFLVLAQHCNDRLYSDFIVCPLSARSCKLWTMSPWAPALQIRSLVAAQGMLAVQPLYTTSRQAYKTFCDVELPADVDVQHCPYAHVDSQAGEHLYFVRPQVCCFAARLVPCTSQANAFVT
jgi:hypothetical protein